MSVLYVCSLHVPDSETGGPEGYRTADTRSLDDFSPAYIIAAAVGIIYKTRAAARARAPTHTHTHTHVRVWV